MNKKSQILIPILLVAIFGCKEEEVVEEPVLRPVRTITAGSSESGRQRTYSGTAQAGLESKLSFKVSGTVKTVAVKVGDNIKKGALLAVLDARDFALQVEQAKASLAEATARQRNAKATFDRTRELYANRSASKSEFDAARATSESAAAAVQATSKQVQLLQQQMNYTRLIAPAEGSIAAVKVEVNENVSAGKTVVVLTSGDEIEVRVSVPEVIISKIKKGDPVLVSFDALPDKNFKAAVEEVGISADESGATYAVTVKLIETDESIRAGMAAEVIFNFTAGRDKSRIVIPTVAVGQDRNGRYVYVVKEVEPGVGAVKRLAVEVGELSDQGLEITKGLKKGEVVVTAGLRFLEDGRRVRLPKTEAK
ncbi:MAG: efflux RND transporter periplasmic adaptor subunit [Proteobacteria bacterium]|nr:efflux RND transporter periplasmic adaptor subunit [Pseudomonadota bacterium]